MDELMKSKNKLCHKEPDISRCLLAVHIQLDILIVSKYYNAVISKTCAYAHTEIRIYTKY